MADNVLLPLRGAPIGNDDYVAIQRLSNRYADAVVRRNAEQWESCWAADAVWDLGVGRDGQSRRVEGRDAIVALWRSAMGGMAAVVQNVLNGEAWTVDGQPDRATGRWYINERFRRANGVVGILLADYNDEYARTADGWLFAYRTLQVHYQGPPDLSADFLNG